MIRTETKEPDAATRSAAVSPLNLRHHSLLRVGVPVIFVCRSFVVNFDRIQDVGKILSHVGSSVVAVQPALLVLAELPRLHTELIAKRSELV